RLRDRRFPLSPSRRSILAARPWLPAVARLARIAAADFAPGRATRRPRSASSSGRPAASHTRRTTRRRRERNAAAVRVAIASRRVPDRRGEGALLRDHGDLRIHLYLEVDSVVGGPAR